jgi:hypothetical protein
MDLQHQKFTKYRFRYISFKNILEFFLLYWCKLFDWYIYLRQKAIRVNIAVVVQILLK